MKGLLAVKERN